MEGITERAGRKLKNDLETVPLPPEKCYRYRIRNGDGDLRVDARNPDDVAYKHDGRTVLIMDDRTARTLAKRKLDFKDGGFCLVKC
jgi:hypothetical protein